MNNKMAINTYLSTIESKNKLSKEEDQRQNHGYGECFDVCQIGEGFGGMGEEISGLRSTNTYLQNSHRDVQYRKWSSQKTYLCDPWTLTMVWGLPEGVGGAG